MSGSDRSGRPSFTKLSAGTHRIPGRHRQYLSALKVLNRSDVGRRDQSEDRLAAGKPDGFPACPAGVRHAVDIGAIGRFLRAEVQLEYRPGGLIYI